MAAGGGGCLAGVAALGIGVGVGLVIRLGETGRKQGEDEDEQPSTLASLPFGLLWAKFAGSYGPGGLIHSLQSPRPTHCHAHTNT